MEYTQVPADVFEKLNENAGILCTSFNTATGEATGQVAATTGGVNVTCTPTYIDYGEDIDNCPKNTKELKKIDDVECKMSGTFVSIDETLMQKLIGASTLTTTGTGDSALHKIVPNKKIASTDFHTLWYVTDYGEGGFIAIKLIDGLSNTGFALQTTDKGKGQFAFEFIGHKSIETPDTIPMEFYIQKAPTPPTP